jgi:glutamate dehydrogenase
LGARIRAARPARREPGLRGREAGLEDTFEAVWTGKTEDDGFKPRGARARVSWRQAALVRALARYRGQSGLDPSQTVQEQALSEHPGVVRLILELFR